MISQASQQKKHSGTCQHKDKFMGGFQDENLELVARVRVCIKCSGLNRAWLHRMLEADQSPPMPYHHSMISGSGFSLSPAPFASDAPDANKERMCMVYSISNTKPGVSFYTCPRGCSVGSFGANLGLIFDAKPELRFKRSKFS
jgi:hypothetical protein